MTIEDRNLLLKDLSGRLPYGVKCLVNYTFCNETTDYEDVKSSAVDTIITINKQTEDYFFERISEWFDVDEFKPYLFPLSSMTEEQRLEIEILTNGKIGIDQDSLWDLTGYCELYISTTLELIQWLYKNHFDIYGLIPKGLAIDATGLNIYTNK